MRKMAPAPGSDAARKMGCSCPMKANHHGRGLNGVSDVYKRKPDCKVHGYIRFFRMKGV
jgi:hypothetical protein